MILEGTVSYKLQIKVLRNKCVNIIISSSLSEISTFIGNKRVVYFSLEYTPIS